MKLYNKKPKEEPEREPELPKCLACNGARHVYVHGHDAVRGRRIVRFGISRKEEQPYWVSASGLPKIPVVCRCVSGAPYTYDPSLPGNSSCARCDGKAWYVLAEGDDPNPHEVLGKTFSGDTRVKCDCKRPNYGSKVEAFDTSEAPKPIRWARAGEEEF